MPNVNGVFSSLNFWHSEVLYIHIRRGASALLVSMDRALPEPQGVKRATESGFTSFLFILIGHQKSSGL